MTFMKYLKDNEELDAIKWMKEAGKVAEKGRCLKALNGTVIVKDGEIIGSGYSGPALDDESNRTCNDDDRYDYSIKPRFDRTCCIHSEWRAILNTLKNNSANIKGSTLYFCGVDNEGTIKKSGKPYCTVCSRLALESGIDQFVLWHEDGICEYPTDEYNALSYSYLKK